MSPITTTESLLRKPPKPCEACGRPAGVLVQIAGKWVHEAPCATIPNLPPQPGSGDVCSICLRPDLSNLGITGPLAPSDYAFEGFHHVDVGGVDGCHLARIG